MNAIGMYTPADIEGSAYLEEARALGRSLKGE